MSNTIVYETIDQFDELKKIMKNNVLGLDFEFGHNGQPLAVGIAGKNGQKEYKFCGVKSPERLRGLQAIEYQDFIWYLHMLNDFKLNNFLVFGPMDIECLRYLHGLKKYNFLFPEIKVYNIQPILSSYKALNGGMRSRNLFETAMFAGVDTTYLNEHFPGSDALCLFKTASMLAENDKDNFEEFKAKLFDDRFLLSIKSLNLGEKAANSNYVKLEKRLSLVQNELNETKKLLQQSIANQKKLLDGLNKYNTSMTRKKDKKKGTLDVKRLSFKKVGKVSKDITSLQSCEGIVPIGKKKQGELDVYVAQIVFHNVAGCPVAVSLRRNGTKNKAYQLNEEAIKGKKKGQINLKEETLEPISELGKRLCSVSGNGLKIILICEGKCEEGIMSLRKQLDSFLPSNAYAVLTV